MSTVKTRHTPARQSASSSRPKPGRWLALAAGFGLACGGASARDQSCAVSTLSGTYVFAASGWGTPAGDWVPKAVLEIIRFNGDGTLIAPAATVANRAGDGQIVQSPPNGTGVYHVDPDGQCTGTLTFDSGPSFILAIAQKGEEVWMIQTNPNNVLLGSAKRVAR